MSEDVTIIGRGTTFEFKI